MVIAESHTKNTGCGIAYLIFIFCFYTLNIMEYSDSISRDGLGSFKRYIKERPGWRGGSHVAASGDNNGHHYRTIAD
jgi:hypothetical protein